MSEKGKKKVSMVEGHFGDLIVWFVFGKYCIEMYIICKDIFIKRHVYCYFYVHVYKPNSGQLFYRLDIVIMFYIFVTVIHIYLSLPAVVFSDGHQSEPVRFVFTLNAFSATRV